MCKIFVITIIILLVGAGCSVAPAAVEEPVINNFTSDPHVVTPGEATMLSWSVANAVSVDIDQGIGNVARALGSKVVLPGTTRTYTLTATNSAGSHTKSIVINVIQRSDNQPATFAVAAPPGIPPPAPPIIISFNAASSRIQVGSSAVLRWNVANATAIIINNNVGSVSERGSEVVSPGSTRTYTMTATNAGGSHTKSVVIRVIQSSANQPVASAAVMPPVIFPPHVTPPPVPPIIPPGRW